jgi:hypothetical protein
MEKIQLKLAAVLLILAGNLASCEEEKEEKKDGHVPYAVCDHDGNYLDTIDMTGNVYLFNDSIPKEIEAELQQEGRKSSAAWIVYVSKDNSATMRVISKHIESICIICNYPDFAKQWEIPLNGQKVYYEGTAFEVGRYLVDIVSYNMVLTILKKS